MWYSKAHSDLPTVFYFRSVSTMFYGKRANYKTFLSLVLMEMARGLQPHLCHRQVEIGRPSTLQGWMFHQLHQIAQISGMRFLGVSTDSLDMQATARAICRFMWKSTES